MGNKITVDFAKYHRNGISGEPFIVVYFKLDGYALTATLTDEQAFVFDANDLEAGYRGDVLFPDLSKAVADYDNAKVKI